MRFLRKSLDSDSRDLITSAGMAFALRGAGAVLAFGFNVAIGRVFGAEGTGLFFTALAMVVILSAISRLGLDNAMLRLIAASAAIPDWARVNGVFRIGMRSATLASLVLAAALLGLAAPLSERLFDTPELTRPMQLMSLGIVTFSLMMLLSESLKGLSRIPQAMLVSGVLWPLFGILLVWPLAQAFGPDGASLTYVGATGAAALCGWLMWRHLRNDTPADTAVAPELWSSARPLWAMAIITTGLLPWAPILLLGIWGSASETGLLGVSTRVANLVAFFLVAVNNVLAPRFAALYQMDETARIRQLARRFALLTALAASPLLLVLIFAGDVVLALFGPEFTDGTTILAILAVGQAFNAATGSVGVLLMMTGNERAVRNGALLAAAIVLVASVVLIPTLGAIGAAIAAAGAVIAMNLFSVFMVRRKLGFLVIPWIR
ncbi:polysaccharide biosynthesis C-terminal domain-containing protein [Tropicimonas sp. TH_r6]|uniref:polysaccharide biosynthesis C-terminal domain-containing protein n=1 Tax=Tropicimonas sp. TH_r6 TaxID=3082085 RepID=UPI002952CC2F|nr:polysaccharide biosynthesis C-terminal domain-containing protein [Tropicimonas sp. TH_r6]MDV7142067.1 polysaccharide biosynthesis C-terminal domain-containing protein [Tropicimonas sp. TH_r6]